MPSNALLNFPVTVWLIAKDILVSRTLPHFYLCCRHHGHPRREKKHSHSKKHVPEIVEQLFGSDAFQQNGPIAVVDNRFLWVLEDCCIRQTSIATNPRALTYILLPVIWNAPNIKINMRWLLGSTAS